MKIGLQLYTVRDSYSGQHEFKEVLRKVKQLGYDGVEFAGYVGFAADELKEFLDEIGLGAISSHKGLHELEYNLTEELEYVTKLGCKYLVCAYAQTTNQEDMERVTRIMSNAYTKGKEYGIEVLYHNHSNEFLPLSDGTLPINMISDVCKLELDTFWAFNAQVEPCSYLRKNADKISLVHLKDGSFEGNPCAIGEGYNNIKGIVAMTEKLGKEWLIVENDHPTPDGLSDVGRSIAFLKNN
ncbi:MAG: Xylose isomerase domain protein barrel [Herbinix sp.]|jgi:sugar phosphate isomerase/epimerase|nr:Xylose isomerase domain protein barrel [Herbinix sp.]